jgi:hypothetical protein
VLVGDGKKQGGVLDLWTWREPTESAAFLLGGCVLFHLFPFATWSYIQVLFAKKSLNLEKTSQGYDSNWSQDRHLYLCVSCDVGHSATSLNAFDASFCPNSPAFQILHLGRIIFFVFHFSSPSI